MKPMVDALRAAVNLRRGELGQAAAWLAEVEIAGRLPDGVADPVQLSRSRVLIALGRPDEALAVLDSLAHNAEAAGRTRTLIESLVVRAQALAAKGRSTAARAAYELAASLAAPERMVAVLGGEGAPERGTKAQTAPVAISAPAALLRGHSLTERELEVLRLIGEGLDNEAIARRLVVAPGTVKKHINRLFAKLEVSSRTQALVRGRAIGLL
jgi:LuxR family maltose regulon positive regulatory protein